MKFFAIKKEKLEIDTLLDILLNNFIKIIFYSI